ncbi:MAG: protein translocase subunit SecDF [Bacteroidales bacterium]|jgi:SecD/SecF fusion protein|nr:protein translocase subunit SecDF [Bacteroidales bacterium]
MQNKGFIRVFAIALALVCLFYLSFSVVTSYYGKKADAYAQGDSELYYKYLDSISGNKVWLGYTLKECREKEINLGLDLKGGMNVTLEVSIPDILIALSDYNSSDIFKQALENARARKNQSDFLTAFKEEFEKINPNAQLSTIFSTHGLKDKISLKSSNSQVISILRLEVGSAIDNSFNVLRSRIDRFGVVQPNIQKIGGSRGRILVELPGIKEPERVRKLLQGSANLEFWETYDASELNGVMSQVNSVLRDIKSNAAAVDTAASEQLQVVENTDASKTASGVDSLAQALKSADASDETQTNEKALTEYIKNNPLYALGISERGEKGPVLGAIAVKDTSAVMGYFNLPQVKRLLPRELSLRWTIKPVTTASDKDKYDRYGLIALKVTSRDKRAPLSGDVITDARNDFNQITNESQVSMKMNAEGTSAWARLTKANIGKSIAISLDNYIYSYPTVKTEIPGGSSEISGNFTPEEAKDLANVLKSGKMPAPAHIVQEDVVGPSLGQEAINRGLISFAIALALIFVYMILYYGWVPGVIADVVLIANTFFMLGILASFNAVLTLPGIAGIVLSLGMAVDANVLIYERCREELASGKNLKKAVEEGFKNALSAIMDGQITTLLIGIILFIFGTGPIKGFATTLIIGIFTSLFTAIFFSRMLFERLISWNKDWKILFTTNITKNWMRGFNFNFIGKRKYGYIISIILCAVIVGSLFVNKLKPGIDFSGGNTYVVRFEQKINADEVRNKLEDVFKGHSLYVITMGDVNQIRISTNFGNENAGGEKDNTIERMLYNNLKDYLNPAVTLEMFIQRYVNNNGTYELANLEKGENYGIQLSQNVGPTVASDMVAKSSWAVLFSLIIMFVYILIRFKNYGYAVGATVSLAHDAFFMIGVYSLCYKFMPFSLDVDQSFIAAILTIIAYSVNDTVVIFDRVRENLTLYPKRSVKEQINNALNVTLSRTFSTSFTVILTLLAMFIFGGEVIRGFMFALLMGTLCGVYSTLFVAAPLAYDIRKKQKDAAALEGKK